MVPDAEKELHPRLKRQIVIHDGGCAQQFSNAYVQGSEEISHRIALLDLLNMSNAFIRTATRIGSYFDALEEVRTE